MYSGLLSSFPVFRSWQGLHNACQLLSSHIRCGLPQWGMIWSTTVAAVNRPCAIHFTHSGCFRRYTLLSHCHLLPYPRLAADGRSGCKGLCSSQYAPSVSFGQPGCLQGFSAFFGITGISFGHNKSRCGYPQRLCTYSSMIHYSTYYPCFQVNGTASDCKLFRALLWR